jgi:hypothetical protein
MVMIAAVKEGWGITEVRDLVANCLSESGDIFFSLDYISQNHSGEYPLKYFVA